MCPWGCARAHCARVRIRGMDGQTRRLQRQGKTSVAFPSIYIYGPQSIMTSRKFFGRSRTRTRGAFLEQSKDACQRRDSVVVAAEAAARTAAATKDDYAETNWYGAAAARTMLLQLPMLRLLLSVSQKLLTYRIIGTFLGNAGGQKWTSSN